MSETLASKYNAVPVNHSSPSEIGVCYSISEKGGVVKKVVEKGKNIEKAPVLSRVYVHIQGTNQDGTKFWDFLHEEMDFILGRGETCKGLEMAISTFDIGEKAEVYVDEEFGFTDNKRPNNCEKNGVLSFVVQLIRFEQEKNLWEMSTEEKIAAAGRKRVWGNECFTKNKFVSAEKQYDGALEFINSLEPTDLNAQVNSIMVTLLLNASACKLKSGKFAVVDQFTTKVLSIEPKNSKALFRRARAKREMGDYDSASADLDACLLCSIGEDEIKSINVEKRLIATSRKEVDAGLKRKFSGTIKSEPSVSILASLKGVIKRIFCCKQRKENSNKKD